MPVEIDPTHRFSNRVEDYVKYRPDYPAAVLDLLVQEAGLKPSAVVADIGSGTGILSRLFLDDGYEVYGVEPNDAMRAAAEKAQVGYERFRSVNARAESTTLPGQSVDLVSAGQAFHWFDGPAARREFLRILKPGGYVVLLWNDWGSVNAPFNRAYQTLVTRFSQNYNAVKHSNVSEGEAIKAFFSPGGFQKAHFENQQQCNLVGLRGRVLSSSYSPTPEDPDYELLLIELEKLFDRYQVQAQVSLDYDTWVYYGRLVPGTDDG